VSGQSGAGLQSSITTRAIGLCLLFALAVAGACGPKTVAPSGVPVWELRGGVVAISASRVDVRHKSGRVIELTIDDRTDLVGAAGKEAWAAVVPGMRVAVQVESDGSGGYRARSVRVFD
jgi:hypothetical protein